ncbi:hypothetical protein [Hyphomicrobium sp.]|uniref:hypothetical protein n=1 Tax=Hyphomicrobium sp. TaxID=82 RepID=UPI003F72ACFA
MLLAIESFVRVFEDLLTGRAHLHTGRDHRFDALPAAHNDNDDSDATTRRWIAGRR